MGMFCVLRVLLGVENSVVKKKGIVFVFVELLVGGEREALSK